MTLGTHHEAGRRSVTIQCESGYAAAIHYITANLSLDPLILIGLMDEWNVVVSVKDCCYRDAWAVLDDYGTVHKSDFYNVLLMRVTDPGQFLDALNRQYDHADLENWLGRLLPIDVSFVFQSAQEFEDKATEAVKPWISRLADRRFHVRMHRRGFKGRLSSQDEERFLDRFILESLHNQQKNALIDFDSPDYIVALETVGQRAGLSLWSREQWQRYPFLGLD